MAGEMVRVFQTADSTLLPIIRSMLDGAGIPHVVQGDHAFGLLPLGPFGAGVTRGLLGAIVLVPLEHAAAANEMLNAFPEAGSDGAAEE
ncbi:MAG TPA: DUF2007 domain-containing protein [Candidatus Polarisedimenticolia bacterium]|nr:DUF2007 domain-containing protein [Candidatus Polarisedimenticolia bacterium]